MYKPWQHLLTSDVRSALTQVQKAVVKGRASKQKAVHAAAKAQPVVTGSRRTSRVTKSRTMQASGCLPFICHALLGTLFLQPVQTLLHEVGRCCSCDGRATAMHQGKPAIAEVVALCPVQIDGFTVLKANNYDLEQGERSVFDQELNRELSTIPL